MTTNLNKVYKNMPKKKLRFKSSKIALNNIKDVEAGLEAQKNIIDDVYLKIDKATALTEELIVMENELFDDIQEFQKVRDESMEKLNVVYNKIEEVSDSRLADDTVGKYYDIITDQERDFLARVEKARDKGLRF